MTQEEKAKAYDEVLEKANELLYVSDEDSLQRKTVEHIFPELKEESEDEKMRRWIINYLDNKALNSGIIQEKTNIKNAIAWLEKQGEQKPDKVEQKFKVGDTMRTIQEAADGIKDGLPVIVSIDKEYYHCTNELIAIKDQDDYEYPPMNRRQKPDKVEPKFKVEDEVVSKISGTHYYITKVSDNFYLTDVGCVIMFNAQDNFELYKQKPAWSEEDSPYYDDICEILINLIHSKTADVNKDVVQKDLDWFVSLKDRVQPQSKQEWWKPSDEQMEYLAKAVATLGDEGDCKTASILNYLRVELKKLRGE